MKRLRKQQQKLDDEWSACLEAKRQRNVERMQQVAGADKSQRQQWKKDDSNFERTMRETWARIEPARQQIKDELRGFELLHRGEREAFIEYCFRTGVAHDSSWTTLAEMRHYGVPTRLLDWTEVLSVALFFALEEYFAALSKYWASYAETRKANRDRGEPYPYFEPPIENTPCIWILNPYRAAGRVTDRQRIWNFALDSRYDYYKNFIVGRTWHFERPVPTYSPWRNPRLAAQQGMFTVHGYERAALEKQYGEGVLAKETISSAAAVFGVRHLKLVCGMSRFTLFRDRETLARQLTEDFLA